MTGSAYLFSAPNGVAGDVTRTDETNVEPAMLIQSGSPLAFAQSFGIPMVYATGGITQYQASNVAADFAGVLVREAPEISGSNTQQGLGQGVPLSSQVQGLAVRGYVSVLCKVGTPARGGIVYICNNLAGGAIGDFQATSSANNVALSLTQAEWAVDGVDASFNAELRIAR